MRKNILFIILGLIFLTPCSIMAQGTIQRDYVTITFTPDHQDWTYDLGKTVEMQVSVRQFNYDLRDIPVTYTWAMERTDTDVKNTVNTGKSGVASIKLKGSKVPGFMTLTATCTVNGEEYSNYITLAFAPEKIQPTTPLPDDFLSFWNATLEAARKFPLQPVFELQQALCTGVSDAYMVRFQNDGKNRFFYGLLRVPKGLDLYHDGLKKYPALIRVPGAGIGQRTGLPEEFTEAGIITLDLGIHGIPINLPEQVYLDLRNVALGTYNSIHLDNRYQYYYRSVYTGCVRAVDLLCSLPFVDSSRLGIYGGSQGGALTIVVAALDTRITCAAPAYPALCELTGSQHGRIDGWPRFFTNGGNRDGFEQKMKTVLYYDVVNFARFVKAPVFFFQGFNDRVCPPTTTYSAYNVMTCPKQITVDYDCAHWTYSHFGDLRQNWLIEQLTK